jgi:hypothetical protein
VARQVCGSHHQIDQWQRGGKVLVPGRPVGGVMPVMEFGVCDKPRHWPDASRDVGMHAELEKCLKECVSGEGRH